MPAAALIEMAILTYSEVGALRNGQVDPSGPPGRRPRPRASICQATLVSRVGDAHEVQLGGRNTIPAGRNEPSLLVKSIAACNRCIFN